MSDQNTVISKIKINPAEEIEVPLHFEMSDFVPAILAQHLTVQGTPDFILVGFYEANSPIMFDPTPDTIEQLKREGYTAECVARIAIPASRFVEFAKVLASVAGILPPLKSEEADVSIKQHNG